MKDKKRYKQNLMLNYKFQFVDGKSDRHIKCQQTKKGNNVVEK